MAAFCGMPGRDLPDQVHCVLSLHRPWGYVVIAAANQPTEPGCGMAPGNGWQRWHHLRVVSDHQQRQFRAALVGDLDQWRPDFHDAADDYSPVSRSGF